MWVAGGIVVVLAAFVLVVATFLEDDRRAVAPRRTGTITAEELRAVDLPGAWRGYDRGHVDALLARAATTLEHVQHYGVLDEPSVAADAPARGRAAGPPSFLADAFRPPGDALPDTPADETTAADDVPLADDADTGFASGEELEDGGGDGAGGLDR